MLKVVIAHFHRSTFTHRHLRKPFLSFHDRFSLRGVTQMHFLLFPLYFSQFFGKNLFVTPRRAVERPPSQVVGNRFVLAPPSKYVERLIY